MIPQDTKERIYSLTRIDEVVSDFVSLKKAGANYKGCCPFHDEKTPSFVVSPAKGIYKCFGCGKSGNAVGFIMEIEKCSFVDALKYLGRKYHVDIVETELTEEEKQRRDIRESLQVINQYAAEFFEKSMWETDEGKSIGLSYFVERGFTEETIRKFRLGFSPTKKTAFAEDAEKKGYKTEYLQKVGLISVGDNYKIDRFHGRVMFPIMSVSGNVIGFGGRVMTPANEHVQGGAKYVNSPESEVYNKSKTLYGISFAKSEISKKDECILVEGYTDVISMHQAGITNVVASSGTSLTNDQIDLLSRFTKNVVIIYDGDNAGIKAATRGIDMILEKDLNVRVLLLPDGDDPDSFARKHTSEEIAQYIETNKVDFLTFKTRLAAKETENDPINRARFINDIAATIAKIPDQIKRAVFIQQCGKILNISEQAFTDQINKINRQYSVRPNKEQASQTVTPKVEQIKNEQIDKLLASEKELTKLLVKYGQNDVLIDDSDIFYEIKKHFWLIAEKNKIEQKDIDENRKTKEINKLSYPEKNSLFQGKLQDYIHNQTTQNIVIGSEISLIPVNETENQIYTEYYAHLNEKGDKITDYLRDFVNAERVADVLSDNNSLDLKYWKKRDINTDENSLNEVIGNYAKETLIEYAKRRIEALRENLCKNFDPATINILTTYNICITLLSKQSHHISR